MALLVFNHSSPVREVYRGVYPIFTNGSEAQKSGSHKVTEPAPRGPCVFHYTKMVLAPEWCVFKIAES